MQTKCVKAILLVILIAGSTAAHAWPFKKFMTMVVAALAVTMHPAMAHQPIATCEELFRRPITPSLLQQGEQMRCDWCMRNGVDEALPVNLVERGYGELAATLVENSPDCPCDVVAQTQLAARQRCPQYDQETSCPVVGRLDAVREKRSDCRPLMPSEDAAPYWADAN